MYNWGYIKAASLAYLDLDENEATVRHMIERFPFYANEVITHVCSAIKPKRTFAEFVVKNKIHTWRQLTNKYSVYVEHLEPIVKPSQLSENEIKFWTEFEQGVYIGELQKMPADFVSFGDDVNTIQEYDFMYNTILRETHDDDFLYKGNDQLVFYKEGVYHISYNARWITFTQDMDENQIIDVPADILDCIPLFIASRCYAVDDEYKSAKFRNEYEMSLARIDDTNYKQTKTFKITGGW